MFFGSFDSSNFITVDKPPAALWPMEISGRIFGFNPWSMLVPNALEGVAAVWLLYATVRRWFGPRAGLLAGALLAMTPVAVLMFRFNNPDALMTLLIVAAAYCVTRAVETASTRWLLGAGAIMGFVVPRQGPSALHRASGLHARLRGRRADLDCVGDSSNCWPRRCARRRCRLVGARGDR